MRYLHSPFKSDGLLCDGDLFLPDDVDKPPVIIIAHGLGYPRFAGVMQFIHGFLEAGVAAYTFDFRNITFSQGEERNFIDPGQQIRDLKAAISHIRRLPEVDETRVGVCGISYSAGYVIAAGAEDDALKEVLCLIPCFNHRDFVIGKGPGFFVPLYFMSVLDTIGHKLGLKPILIPMKLPGYLFEGCESPYFYPGYSITRTGKGKKFGYEVSDLSIKQEATEREIVWTNLFPARLVFGIMRFDPLNFISKVTSPTLIVAAKKDSITPFESVKSVADKFLQVEVASYDGDHFDLGNRVEMIEVITGFIRKHFSK